MIEVYDFRADLGTYRIDCRPKHIAYWLLKARAIIGSPLRGPNPCPGRTDCFYADGCLIGDRYTWFRHWKQAFKLGIKQIDPDTGKEITIAEH